MAKIASTLIFQTDSGIVKKTLNEPNYLIEYSDNEVKEKYCIIYFSSNNIYFPNREDVFITTIIEKNKFEWYNSRIQKGAKHIFIRDIQKQWYLYGINKEINSIEKLLAFLKIETEGYKTIFLGSSAGGYASVLFGSILNAETIFSFNGQFQLFDLLKRSNEKIDPIIFREQFNHAINKYFTIKKYIKEPAKVYYFFSNKSSVDKVNYEHIKKVGLTVIFFNTSNHGIPFVRSALPFVLNAPIKTINSWKKKSLNPILFSIRYGGLLSTFRVLYENLKIKWHK